MEKTNIFLFRMWFWVNTPTSLLVWIQIHQFYDWNSIWCSKWVFLFRMGTEWTKWMTAVSCELHCEFMNSTNNCNSSSILVAVRLHSHRMQSCKNANVNREHVVFLLMKVFTQSRSDVKKICEQNCVWTVHTEWTQTRKSALLSAESEAVPGCLTKILNPCLVSWWESQILACKNHLLGLPPPWSTSGRKSGPFLPGPPDQNPNWIPWPKSAILAWMSGQIAKSLT